MKTIPLTYALKLQGPAPVCTLSRPLMPLRSTCTPLLLLSVLKCRFQTKESNVMQSHVPETHFCLRMTSPLYLYSAVPLADLPPSTRHVNLMKKLTLIQQRDTDSTEACLVVCIRRHTRSPEAPAEVRSKKGVGGVDLFLVGITSTFTFTQRDAHAWAKPLHIPNVSKQRTNTSVESHFIFSRF